VVDRARTDPAALAVILFGSHARGAASSSKLDELDGYLDELRSIAPRDLEDYVRVEKRRSCELIVRCSLDACIVERLELRKQILGSRRPTDVPWDLRAGERIRQSQ
jgi:predicted nucleotidyltransferase